MIRRRIKPVMRPEDRFEALEADWAALGASEASSLENGDWKEAARLRALKGVLVAPRRFWGNLVRSTERRFEARSRQIRENTQK